MSTFTATYFKDTELTTQDHKSIDTTDNKKGELYSITLSAHRVVKVEQVAGHITDEKGKVIVTTDIIATDDTGVETTLTIFHK